jgi:hypothetical protein
MHTQNKIDTLDEALRVIFLEGAKDAPETADAEMQLILSSPSDIAMSEDKKAMLIQKLNTVIVSFSFGQLLQQAMHNLNVTEEVIAEKSKIPVSVVADLKNDAIYTNNVPIVLFKNLLSALGLSFKPVKQLCVKHLKYCKTRLQLEVIILQALALLFVKVITLQENHLQKILPKPMVKNFLRIKRHWKNIYQD